MIESVFSVERPALVTLWNEVFGDPPELAERFLALLPAFGCGFAAAEEGRVLGAAYWIDGLELAGEKCGYLYAVAVCPEAMSIEPQTGTSDSMNVALPFSAAIAVSSVS